MISESRQKKFSQQVNQNKHGCNSCPGTFKADSDLVQARGGFQEQLYSYNEIRRVNLKFCLADFVYIYIFASGAMWQLFHHLLSGL